MKRQQNILEDFNTHIFNGGLVTKIVEDEVVDGDHRRHSYKMQFRLSNLDYPMTVTVPLVSIYQVEELIGALQRTLGRMAANLETLKGSSGAQEPHRYIYDGRAAEGDDLWDQEKAISAIKRLYRKHRAD